MEVKALIARLSSVRTDGRTRLRGTGRRVRLSSGILSDPENGQLVSLSKYQLMNELSYSSDMGGHRTSVVDVLVIGQR